VLRYRGAEVVLWSREVQERWQRCKGGAEQPRAEHEQRDADVQMCSVGAEVVVQRC